MSISTERAFAEAQDRQDRLAGFRERFYLQPGTIYMDGNSLGLFSHDAERALQSATEQWKKSGIHGWSSGEMPWGAYFSIIGREMAALVGAEADEVVATASLTVNLHTMVATLYRPTGRRRKILANELEFPTDVYALQGQIALHGGDPAQDLVRVESRDGRTLDEDDLIAGMTEEVALAILPSVLYRSGQLLDMARLTAAARERGIIIGWDCAHSIGAIPHQLDAWGADFAVWCGYKYLNGGPGSIAGLYVNRRHFGLPPGLPGWSGVRFDVRFEMRHDFVAAPDASAWQISTPPVLSAAPLLGSLAIINDAGLDNVRAKSLALTDYLIDLLQARELLTEPYGYAIGTPLEHNRRGGHVAVEHAQAPQIVETLARRGVIADFRAPNVVRLAPVALYTSFGEVWDVVEHLREIIERGEVCSQSPATE